MSLLAMQRDMRAWLVSEDGDAALRMGAGAAPGLRVHQNNYRAQLIACLTDSFAHTCKWIGGAAFETVAAHHIDRVPPSSWTLDAYPRDFAATLAMHYPDDPEVCELAWLECALAEAFVGPEALTLAITDIAGIDWDAVTLAFTPTLDIAPLTTNAPSIWTALESGEAPPPAERLPEAGAILVWRHEQVSCFRAIDQIEHQAIGWVHGSMSFATLCERMVASWGQTDGIARAGALLGCWIRDGLAITR